MSLYELGTKSEISTTSAMTYGTKPHRDGKRRGLFSVQEIKNLAGKLRCSPLETQRLIILGCMEFAPRELGEYVEQLEREYAKSVQGKNAESNPDFRLVIGAIEEE